jgi:hypothetical protein
MTEGADRWLEELTARIRHLRRLADRLRRLRNEAARPETHPLTLSRRHAEVAALLEKAAAWDWAGGWQTLQAYLETLRAELPERWIPWRQRWFQDLTEALGPLAESLRLQGSWLSLGFLRIEPDLERDRVTVSYGPEDIETRRSDPRALGRWLQAWYRDLQRRALPPERFVEVLWQAYREARNPSGDPRVPIAAVYRRLVVARQSSTFWTDAEARHFTPYPRYLFSYELYRLREAPDAWTARFQIQLLPAAFEATRRRGDYVWVPEGFRPEGARYAFLVMQRRDEWSDE